MSDQTTVDPNQESRVDKILKLLRKAESSEHAAEAEAFTAKAQQLMVQYAIDDAMLAAAKGVMIDEKIVEKRITVKGIYQLPNSQLAHGVGRAMGCRTFQSSGRNATIVVIVGFESDVRNAEMMFTSLMIQNTRALDEFNRKNPPPSWMSNMEKFKRRRSFLMGFADEIDNRFAEANQVAKREAKAAASDGGTGMELVLVDKSKRVDDWMDSHYSLTRGRASRVSMGSGGYGEGRAAGARANIGGQGVGRGTKGSIGR